MTHIRSRSHRDGLTSDIAVKLALAAFYKTDNHARDLDECNVPHDAVWFLGRFMLNLSEQLETSDHTRVAYRRVIEDWRAEDAQEKQRVSSAENAQFAMPDNRPDNAAVRELENA